ncbi:MAG: hypothetical protein ABSB97_06640 [Thermoplasmata archaeon]
MTSELLSGPDLGAGFLHQLSLDRDGERTTFTYHAQDGGADANGPPKGPLDRFGFVHPASPCMFGGSRCWQRRFPLPLSEAPKVRRAYNRNRFVLETMMGQVYDGVPPALDPGLREVVARIAPSLDTEGVEWYVGGSTAAWLLGAPVRPHDIDLGTTRAGVDRIASLLGDYLIEPVAPTDWPGPGIVRGARAFVGTFQEGIRVEWSVPIEPRTPEPFEEWSGRPGVARCATATVGGRTVLVTRPEYALLRAAERDDRDGRHGLAGAVRRLGPDRELLDVLLSRSSLSASDRASLRAEVGA